MTNFQLELEKELKKLRIKYKKDKNLKIQLKTLISDLIGQYCEVTDHQIKLNLPIISLDMIQEIHFILKTIKSEFKLDMLKFSIQIEDFQFDNSNKKYLVINW